MRFNKNFEGIKIEEKISFKDVDSRTSCSKTLKCIVRSRVSGKS